MKSAVLVGGGVLAFVMVAAVVGYSLNTGGRDEGPTVEERLDRIEMDLARLQKNDDALLKTNGEMLADVAERLYRAGITDEKNLNVARWWCIGGEFLCVRDRKDCELLRENAKCLGQRVAYCISGSARLCLGTRERCEKALVSEGKRRDTLACHGVE